MYDAHVKNSTRPKHIHPIARGPQVEEATPRFTPLGRTPMVAIAKDVPHEEFNYDHGELGYRERLAGPCPQATNSALLHQHEAQPFGIPSKEKMAILPPLVNLFTVITLH